MTSNPMTNSRVYENINIQSEPMTISGAVNKTLILLIITVLTAGYTWNMAAGGMLDRVSMLITIGAVAGLIIAITAAFKPNRSNILAPIYSICEGLVVGGISFSYYNMFYPGIVANAAIATFVSLFAMLVLYKTKLIQATDTFKKVVITSTFAIFIYYMIIMIANFLGHSTNTFGTPIGIGISILVCAIASLNFILDFDFIEQGQERLAPKYFEWYGALSLLITTIWLYLEMLRLLAQLSSRR